MARISQSIKPSSRAVQRKVAAMFISPSNFLTLSLHHSYAEDGPTLPASPEGGGGQIVSAGFRQRRNDRREGPSESPKGEETRRDGRRKAGEL
jgi:hypothetical protein